MLPNFTVTPAAEKFLRRIVRFSGLPSGAGVRLRMSSGGCSEYEAELIAAAAAQSGDETTEINGLRLFLPGESRILLDGLTIDFVDTPESGGLAFSKGAQGQGAMSA